MSRFRAHKLGKAGYAGEPIEHINHLSVTLNRGEDVQCTMRIEIRYDPDKDCVMLRCNEGRLLVAPNVANEIEIYLSDELHRNEDL